MMIRKFQEGNVYTLIVEGRIDMLNSAEFQKEAEECAAKLVGKNGTLVFNFNGLKYISSAGLRVVLSVHKQMIKNGGELKIINVLPAILEIFSITGFTNILNISEVGVNDE